MAGSQDDPSLNTRNELWLNEPICCVDSGLDVEVGAEKASILGVVRESKDFITLTTINEGVHHPHHQFNNPKIAMHEQDSCAARVSLIIVIPTFQAIP